jgi:hypothetical protein
MYADHRHGHNFWQALRLLDGASVGAVLVSRRGKTQPPVTGEPSVVVESEAQERQMGAQVAPPPTYRTTIQPAATPQGPSKTQGIHGKPV